MLTYDMLIIGHITQDSLVYQGKTTGFTGGAAYFAAFAARPSNAKIRVVTKLAKKDFGVLDDLRREGMEVNALLSPQTTSIENIFETDDLDRRKVRLISQADPFYPQDLLGGDAKVYYLGGLFEGEIPHALIEHVAKKGEVALDMQAMLRSSDGIWSGFKDWAEKKRYLPMATYLKVDSAESEVTTGTVDREKAAKMLHDWGAKEIMVTHSSEVIIYDGERIFRAPFTPRNLSGRTGRGDTCFGSYVSWRLHHGIEESVKYAAALTSIKMETFGPFRGTLKDVLERMKAL